jgi:uncharacterized protein (TIGR02217 family)
MAFLTERFPVNISYGSSGGPGYKTKIVESPSGFEYRNQNWSKARHKYNAATGIQKADDLDALVAFFHLAAGRANSFGFKDWADYKTCATSQQVQNDDQVLVASATGGEQQIQLFKTYTVGAISSNRDIILPVNGTVLIALNTVQLTETTDYSINYTTGLLSLVVPLGVGDLLTAGFEFDVLCRFGVDELSLSFDAYRVNSTTVPILEVREQ